MTLILFLAQGGEHVHAARGSQRERALHESLAADRGHPAGAARGPHWAHGRGPGAPDGSGAGRVQQDPLPDLLGLHGRRLHRASGQLQQPGGQHLQAPGESRPCR